MKSKYILMNCINTWYVIDHLKIVYSLKSLFYEKVNTNKELPLFSLSRCFLLHGSFKRIIVLKNSIILYNDFNMTEVKLVQAETVKIIPIFQLSES